MSACNLRSPHMVGAKPTPKPRQLRLPCQQRCCVSWVQQRALIVKGPAPRAGTAAVSTQGWERAGSLCFAGAGDVFAKHGLTTCP